MSDDPNPEIKEDDWVATPPLELTEQEDNPEMNIVLMAVVVEGGLAVIALGLAYFFGLFDSSQPLNSIAAATWHSAIVWGGLGTLPLLIYLAVFGLRPPKILQPMKDFVDQKLKPIFEKCSLTELAILSLLAGFCEEIFFRWSLQGGISSMSGSLWAGLLIASVLFGLCHWVNAAYGITTTIMGIYFGLMMHWSGTWLAPAIAHALFDFVALVFIARFDTTDNSAASSQAI